MAVREMARASDPARREYQIFQPAAGEHLTLSQVVHGHKILTVIRDEYRSECRQIRPESSGEVARPEGFEPPTI